MTLGLLHSLEADHIITVSSIALDREKISQSTRDGFLWGIGHLVIILFFALIVIQIKILIPDSIFKKSELLVAVFMVIIGIIRIRKSFQTIPAKPIHSHSISLLAGFVHGIAGSSVILAIAFQKYTSFNQIILFLTIFGLGSILSMTLATFSIKVFIGKNIFNNNRITKILLLITGLICIFYALYIVRNLFWVG